MGPTREPTSFTVAWGSRQLHASGPVAIGAVIILVFVLAALIPAYLTYRASANIAEAMERRFDRVDVAHDRAVDISEAALWVNLPPAVRDRMALPRWMRDGIERKVRESNGASR